MLDRCAELFFERAHRHVGVCLAERRFFDVLHSARRPAVGDTVAVACNARAAFFFEFFQKTDKRSALIGNNVIKPALLVGIGHGKLPSAHALAVGKQIARFIRAQSVRRSHVLGIFGIIRGQAVFFPFQIRNPSAADDFQLPELVHRKIFALFVTDGIVRARHRKRFLHGIRQPKGADLPE